MDDRLYGVTILNLWALIQSACKTSLALGYVQQEPPSDAMIQYLIQMGYLTEITNASVQ